MSTQKRTITLDFHVEQHVRIAPLYKDGVVVAIFLDAGSPQYKVRYFKDEEPVEFYFYAWELDELVQSDTSEEEE